MSYHLQEIVEFGGGYGSFFRLLKNLGYTNKYFIYDLPVMCASNRSGGGRNLGI